MRIPLDYYQILGLPENSLSELKQAYQDRLCQMPRQEYSDAAIESRKQLISLAYQVLSDPHKRIAYEQSLIAPVEAEDGNGEMTVADAIASSSFNLRPDLEIAPEHFLGGLLILFEIGEYEEVNSICMPYIGNDGRSSNSGSLYLPNGSIVTASHLPAPGDRQIDPTVLSRLSYTGTGNYVIPLKPDIILTMAFSLIELGDREWRTACYEPAVSHFEAARKILEQEDLFPQIQGQVERRLDRLRPYRISYLVALPLDRHEERRVGIQFLEEILERACTHEIECRERFGLNSERTIQFIHETLPHLTAGEQIHVFSQLARDSHPSGAVSLSHMQLACTYLHVHALMAQGFVYHNPQLISRAQQIILYRLSERLDVSIEQATCAILMGQTDYAEAILRSAPESAGLVVIRQQSQGLPSLLRGLCWYIESSLKDEIFPCFRDLIGSNPSLQNYFSDPDVQDFADRASVAFSEQVQPRRNIPDLATSTPQLINVEISGTLTPGNDFDRANPPREFNGVASDRPVRASMPHIGSRSNLASAWQSPLNQLGSGVVLPAERVIQVPPIPSPAVSAAASAQELSNNNVIQFDRERMRRRPSNPTARTLDAQAADYDARQIPLAPVTASKLMPTSKAEQLTRINRSPGGPIVRRRRRGVNIPRMILVGTGGATCVLGAMWLVNTVRQNMTATKTLPIVAPSAISVPPVKEIPAPVPESPKPVATELLTKETAGQIIQTWLSAKAQSLGAEHQTAQLPDILVEPLLSRAIDRAKTLQENGGYIQYKHIINVASVFQPNPLAKEAKIEAQVQEDAEYFDPKQPKPIRVTTDRYLVKYDLVRQEVSGATPESRWYIKQINVIN